MTPDHKRRILHKTSVGTKIYVTLKKPSEHYVATYSEYYVSTHYVLNTIIFIDFQVKYILTILRTYAWWILSFFCNKFNPLFSGGSRCLDALAAALKQSCEGGKTRWYTSTRNQQLASLGVPTMHVRVDDQTPTSLWYSRQPPNRPNPRSSRGCVLSRVPVVRAHRLAWGLSMCALVETADFELWTWSERLELRGPISSSI